MACKYCHDLNSRNDKSAFLVKLSDLQESCRFCSLLKSFVYHFLPSAKDNDLVPFLRIDQQADDIIDVEVAVDNPIGWSKSNSAATVRFFYIYNPTSS